MRSRLRTQEASSTGMFVNGPRRPAPRVYRVVAVIKRLIQTPDHGVVDQGTLLEQALSEEPPFVFLLEATHPTDGSIRKSVRRTEGIAIVRLNDVADEWAAAPENPNPAITKLRLGP